MHSSHRFGEAALKVPWKGSLVDFYVGVAWLLVACNASNAPSGG